MKLSKTLFWTSRVSVFLVSPMSACMGVLMVLYPEIFAQMYGYDSEFLGLQVPAMIKTIGVVSIVMSVVILIYSLSGFKRVCKDVESGEDATRLQS